MYHKEYYRTQFTLTSAFNVKKVQWKLNLSAVIYVILSLLKKQYHYFSRSSLSNAIKIYL